MNGEAEKTCPGCGKPVKEGASFCTDCGAALGGPAGAGDAATAPVPPVTQEATQPLPQAGIPAKAPPTTEAAGEEPPAPGYAPGPPPRKSKAALLVGLIGGVLVVAGIVVLVLWLTMWRDGGGGTDEPIALAEKYISAMEKGDVDAYLACFEEGFLEDIEIFEGMDMKELLKMSFEMMTVKFEDYALELKSEQGSSATVVTTEGNAVFSVMGFEQEYDLADDPMVFEMTKKGGRWYLTQDPMPGSMGGDVDFDMDDLDMGDLEDLDMGDMEGFNLEDMEDLESFLPEGMSLEDLENMSPEQLQDLLDELEQLMEDLPGNSS